MMGGSVLNPRSGNRPRPVQAFVSGGFRLQTSAAKGRRAACGVRSVRMSVMEKERMAQDFKDVDTRVIGALEKLGSRRLTVADVSSVSGTSVQETEKELLLLSQLTGGKLEVRSIAVWHFASLSISDPTLEADHENHDLPKGFGRWRHCVHFRQQCESYFDEQLAPRLDPGAI
mmetsp:Transcript_27265/g.106496  ORF Transcript_27265/g.106496 Transcript_27265/m.106496 type:complete len:173 (+) Transcript_27265:293-811(+)